MRSRLLRTALVGGVIGVLVAAVPLLLIGNRYLVTGIQRELTQRADDVLLVLRAEPAPDQAAAQRAVESVRSRAVHGDRLRVQAVAPGVTVVSGPVPQGPVLRRSATSGQASVTVALPRSVLLAQQAMLWSAVAGLGVLAVGLSAATAVVQSRLIGRSLAVLADNADRIGRGEPRLVPLDSGMPELDRINAGIARSAESMARTVAAEREFASDASHQLRTPLTALSMRLEEIAASDDVEVMQEEARVGLTQLERLTLVIDTLLRHRRSARESMRAVLLQQVLGQQSQEWTTAFRERRRRLVVDSGEPVHVLANENALSQVFATLLENSLVHGEGTCTVSARRTGLTVVVEVADEGRGIPPELGPRVFERSVSAVGSSGLGLALARDLAEADGARLELVRASPPVFAVFLNVAEETAPRR